ncbi:MAG TPA: class I SAM-dependent methyltransferase [Kofleriaceae bacterium]
MTDRLRKQWEALGARDPYWAVLTHPDKKGARWNKEQFFQTGVAEIDEVEQRLASLGISPHRGVALDYGCGVGRLSRALAPRFERVIGVDISEAMLVEARVANELIDNLELMRGSGHDLAEIASRSVDFIYSNIVLQHSPRDVQRRLIQEFCRVLAPGGALVFQTPSRANLRTIGGALHFVLGNRILNIPRRIVYGKDGVMELHAVAKRDVMKLLAAGGVKLIEAERYDSAGPAFISYRYFGVRT